MAIKGANTAIDFSLQSISLYDWEYTDAFTIATYNDNNLIGSIDVTPNPDYSIINATQANLLNPSFFNNIDEIRFYPKVNPVFNLSFNNISLSAASVLPVKLASFTGSTESNGDILLEWTTAMEQNSARFEIEKSENGIDFIKTGSVEAKVNPPAGSNYHFRYTRKPAQVTFFRLKQIDKDGNYDYSPVISVRDNSNSSLISASPNPVKGLTTITSGQGNITGIHVFSASAILVKNIKGNNADKMAVDMSSLPRGAYYIQVTTTGGTGNTTIIKE